MNDLTTKEFVNLVSKNPRKYLCSDGITEMNGLIRGFDNTRGDIAEIDIMGSFSIWLKTEKYPEFSTVGVSWCRILLVNHPNETRALDKFFKLWGEYENYNLEHVGVNYNCPKMRDLTTKDFVDLVSKRPGMFVVSEGVIELHGLINGFNYTRVGIDKINIINDFSLWLRTEKYHNFAKLDICWPKILLFNFSSEKRALDRFFELWVEFLVIYQKY